MSKDKIEALLEKISRRVRTETRTEDGVEIVSWKVHAGDVYSIISEELPALFRDSIRGFCEWMYIDEDNPSHEKTRDYLYRAIDAYIDETKAEDTDDE